MPVEQVLTLLREAPPRIAAMTAGLSEGQLHAPPEPDEWSANEVLAHMRACADVRGGAALRIIAEDAPKIRAVDPRRHMRNTDYVKLDFRTVVAGFRSPAC
jgi:DinB superfamily